MPRRRLARIRDVAERRLRWVRCAIEHVNHRHNTSAILRTCDALGVHHVHLIGQSTFVPARGPSRGADHWLALHRHDGPAQAIEAIRAAGCQIWIADLVDNPVAPAEVPLDTPVCLWFGAEVLGVSEVARQAADGVVTIPMRGMAQSLNVSVAAALALNTVTERARERHGDEALMTHDARNALRDDWFARERVELSREAARQWALARLGEE